MDAIRPLLLRHRDLLRRACGVCAVAVPLGFAAGALAVDGWPARRFLLLYVAPFFAAFFVWARIRLGRLEMDRPGALAVDAVAVVLGAVRFAGLPVPFSGHMLFFTFSALTTRSAPYLMMTMVLIAETTWYKLVSWRDPRSWALGIAAGAALAAARILLQRTVPSPANA